MDATNNCTDVKNFNFENSSADNQYVVYKNASVFLPLQVENSIRNFWKKQNHHSHNETENKEKNKTLNVPGALTDKHGKTRKTNESLDKFQRELIKKSMNKACPDKSVVNSDCKTKENNTAMVNNQKKDEIRNRVRTFHGRKTSTAVLREMKLEVSSFSVGDYHIDCRSGEPSFVLKVVLYRRELIYVISMTMPNDSKKNVIANVEIPLSDITEITITEYDLQLLLNKIPQIRFEVFLKVGLNAKRRIAYPEEFDIFEGNFGMSLVHQIQLKHPECRKLVKKFLKFDKTLKSLLVCRKRNSDITYYQSKISDVDLSLFDSKSSTLPSHKNIREGK
ncbi:hypothetical protein T10_4726 [Trichinella papuae]|uniref:Uncharacterized protein n=1 Tax=Trichinella papuae TaxID=268474 RepID=A0A0V1MKU5_9BILA|nr:hypothetical protein T10_4726 [Trichinella papuae]